jgi:hypothetical protein
MAFHARFPAALGCILATLLSVPPESRAGAGVTAEEVEHAIHDGVAFLKDKQRGDGSWADVENDAHTGTTSLIVYALLTAGEPPTEPHVARALNYLREFTPDELRSVYAVALQAMVFAAAEPERDRNRITAAVDWLERAQITAGDKVNWPGSWTYSHIKNKNGDNSNTQYALLGLNAAAEVGIKVKPEVWTLSRQYWERCQRADGSWAYTADGASTTTSSMTCAGISSLIITGLKRYEGLEFLQGDQIHDCGKVAGNDHLKRATNWLSNHFFVGQNYGMTRQWKFYYLYGLERAGRLAGQRYFGSHDWYREGAEQLVHDQDKLSGSWVGNGYEEKPIATSFALLFLAKGRSPVLVNKLRHGPGDDWHLDPDDVRNLVNQVSRTWKHLLTWQVVDPNHADVEDLLQAPIVYFNGHEAPVFEEKARKTLREYVEQGGFIFAEACCSRPEFDAGFRELMIQLFPEKEYKLHELATDHPVWRARHELDPKAHPLWGIEHGCRTVVIYSPGDLSCYWNQAEVSPNNPAVGKALRIGENVVDYATGREMPADKLAARPIANFKNDSPRRNALHIAKLRHGGDWNVAPLAVPNLMDALRKPPLKYDVVLNHEELLPSDPKIVNFPFIYIHGRAALAFSKSDLEHLRHHLEPGGGVLFADAACGSPSFDKAFRKFAAELLPNNPLIPIPREDEIYTDKIGFNLKDVQYSKAAGGGQDYPQLEGVKIDGHWAVIYSKYDIGCALERHQGLDCKGYTYESALKIAANIVIYSTMP